MSNNRVYICDALRTPVGKLGGMFKKLTALQLAVPVVQHLIARNRVPANLIDEVIVGQGYGSAEAANIGKALVLDAELPDSVCGYSVDRRCASGLQAIVDAMMMIQTRRADLIIAGGAESLSHAPFYSTTARWGAHGDIQLKDSLKYGRIFANGQKHPIKGGMLETAENLRREFALSREDQDAFSYESHLRACRGIAAGKFKNEILPIEVNGRMLDTDEHPRADTTVDGLAALKPVLLQQDPDATVTAGNSSGQNDAASFCLIASEAMAERLGLRPMVEILDWSVAGVPAATMGLGPVPAIQKLLERTGLSLADMDRIEINEAFAAQVLACSRALNFGEDDFKRLNVNGSGISLGHPIGATGARIVTSLANELLASGAQYGLVSMCIGGGQGMAAVIRNIHH